MIIDIRNNCFINIVVEHGIEDLTTCVYSLMDFYLIEKIIPPKLVRLQILVKFDLLPPPPPPPMKKTGFAPLYTM